MYDKKPLFTQSDIAAFRSQIAWRLLRGDDWDKPEGLGLEAPRATAPRPRLSESMVCTRLGVRPRWRRVCPISALCPSQATRSLSTNMRTAPASELCCYRAADGRRGHLQSRRDARARIPAIADSPGRGRPGRYRL